MRSPFLKADYPTLAQLGEYAEQYYLSDSAASLNKLRVFGEFLVKEVYVRHGLEMYSTDTFLNLLDGAEFQQITPKVVIDKLHLIRIKGNAAAHEANFQATKADCLLFLKEAHDLAKWFLISQGKAIPQDAVSFTAPEGTPDKDLKEKNDALKKKLKEQGEVMKNLLGKLIEAQKKIKDKDAEKQDATTKGQQAADSLQFSEEQTRKRLIDEQISIAGWKIGVNGANTPEVGQEIPVQHQPTASGVGAIDYVLYAANGKPLAVIEAKKTSVDPTRGKKQAVMYADGLEKETGTRPVIFYTNGFEIWMWDDAKGEPPRRLYGYYSRESLEYTHFQRSNRSDLSTMSPDKDIAGRSYQVESIKRVTEHFSKKKRKALIIQATGTGKTRVSIALSDLLIRGKWAKRILFLCDRKELRKQAKDNFEEHLPHEPSHIVKGSKVENQARIYVATYPTMIGCFQSYDPGFFDLVIADESHRSIYNRYRDIFKWFDSYQLGLTATPVKFTDRNTFSMFECEDKLPTAEYSYDEAISHKPPFLSYFEVTKVTTKFLRDGIKWSELTDDQKEQLQLEEEVDDPEAIAVEGKDVGKKVFAMDTDKKILENLMVNGIKTANGTHVGKSIIFARSQPHANHLQKLFDDMYPQYGGKLSAVITSKVERSDELLKEFKDPSNPLHIAISVDMLDTGIDVPQVVNLVFAKPVKSFAKFWQMIGRGTRLCPGLFGPGKDKTRFEIYDHYGNFEYFEIEYKEKDPSPSKSLLQAIFEERIAMGEAAIQSQDFDALELSKQLVKADINSLPSRSIAVMDERQAIEEVKASQDLFAASTKALINTRIAKLMQYVSTRGDEIAYEFDLTMTRLMVARLQGSSKADNLVDKIVSWVSRLPINLPQVAAKQSAIQKAKQHTLLRSGATIKELDGLRLELQGIMKHIKGGGGGGSVIPTLSALQDSDLEVESHSPGFVSEPFPAYRERVHKVLEGIMENDPVITKLRKGEKVTDQELKDLGEKIQKQDPTLRIEDFKKYPEAGKDIGRALLGIVGMDGDKVSSYFSEFLQNHPSMLPNQQKFLSLLQQRICKFGPILAKEIYEIKPPGMDDNGFDVVFGDDDQDQIISIIRTINDDVA